MLKITLRIPEGNVRSNCRKSSGHWDFSVLSPGAYDVAEDPCGSIHAWDRQEAGSR